MLRPLSVRSNASFGRGQWLSELLPWSAGELKARDAIDEATGVNGDVIWEDMGYIIYIYRIQYDYIWDIKPTITMI